MSGIKILSLRSVHKTQRAEFGRVLDIKFALTANTSESVVLKITELIILAHLQQCQCQIKILNSTLTVLSSYYGINYQFYFADSPNLRSALFFMEYMLLWSM